MPRTAPVLHDTGRLPYAPGINREAWAYALDWGRAGDERSAQKIPADVRKCVLPSICRLPKQRLSGCFLQLRVSLSYLIWFTPTCTCPLHKSERMASPLKHCQPGTGKAALYAHTGRFLSVDGLSGSATLSAFWGAWPGRFPTVQLAHPLAAGGWASALLAGALCLGLALNAGNAPTRCAKCKVLGHTTAPCFGV